MSAADPATRWPVKLKGTVMALHAALVDTYGDGTDEYQEDEEELSDRIGTEATDAAFIVANQHSTDTNIVNAIALALGTHREWNGGDTLEDIANLISLVRQHPGDRDPAAYATRLLAEHPSNELTTDANAAVCGSAVSHVLHVRKYRRTALPE